MTLSSQTIKNEKRTTYGCYFWRTGRHLCRYLSSTRVVTLNGLANAFTIRTNQSDLWKSSSKLSWNWYQWWRREMSVLFSSRANTCQKHNKIGRKTRSHNTRQEKTKQGTQPLHRSSFCFENVSLPSPVFSLLSNRIYYLKTFASDEKIWTWNQGIAIVPNLQECHLKCSLR